MVVKLIFPHERKNLGLDCVEKRMLRRIFMPVPVGIKRSMEKCAK
jgi:hypothetical protein